MPETPQYELLRSAIKLGLAKEARPTPELIRDMIGQYRVIPWDRRGMVVGHVQSGKTANYTGLICKAADAGYKLIVVIAGIHNNLRNQTQQRIDEGFIGKDSAALHNPDVPQRPFGVSRYANLHTPYTLTSATGDFDAKTAGKVGGNISIAR